MIYDTVTNPTMGIRYLFPFHRSATLAISVLLEDLQPSLFFTLLAIYIIRSRMINQYKQGLLYYHIPSYTIIYHHIPHFLDKSKFPDISFQFSSPISVWFTSHFLGFISGEIPAWRMFCR